MINRNQISKRLKKHLPKAFQEPAIGYLGVSSDEDADVIAAPNKVYVRIGDYDSPEYDEALISQRFLSYYASMIKPNLKVELVMTKRGDLKVHDIDIYQEMEWFGGVYPTPNIIIDVGSDSITGILKLRHGGTEADLSTSGAATHFVRQVSTGAPFTVSGIVSADLTTALMTPPAIGGTTPAAITANPMNVTTYAQFAEQGSTPSAPANTSGRLYARDVLGFTRFGYIDSNSLVVDISRDRTTEVNNATGSTISALRVVRINGASGSSPYQPTITPAQANSAANADGVIGVTIASINNSANGRVMLHGRLENVDTSTLAVGAVYVDASTAGVLTATKPAIGRRVGYVLRQNATTGVLLVDPGELDTDTTYSVFTGATSGADGSTGLVPQPLSGQQRRVLTADGTWKNTMDDVTIGSNVAANGTFVAFTSRHNQYTELQTASGILSLTYAEANATPPTIRTQKARGTGYLLPGQTLLNDVIALWNMQSYGTSNYDTSAQIRAVATQDHTNTARGSKIEIYTSANASSGGGLAATFGQDKSLTMNNAPVIVGTSYLGMSQGSNAGSNRLWQSSTDKTWVGQNGQGLYTTLDGKFWALMSSTTITGTTATSIVGATTWGTLTIPANDGVAGTIYEFEFVGRAGAAAGRIRFDPRLNGSSIAGSGWQTFDITNTGGFSFRIKMTAIVVNTSGTSNLIVQCSYSGFNGTGFVNSLTAPINYTTSSANAWTFFMFFDTSPSTSSLTVMGGAGYRR